MIIAIFKNISKMHFNEYLKRKIFEFTFVKILVCVCVCRGEGVSSSLSNARRTRLGMDNPEIFEQEKGILLVERRENRLYLHKYSLCL